MDDLFPTVFLFSTFLNLLSAGILFFRATTRDINPSNYFLAGFFFIAFTYGITSYIFEFHREPEMLALVYGHFAPLWYLIGPFTYFYVRFTLSDKIRLNPVDLLHFIPFGLQFINLLPYFFWSFDSKMALAEQMIQDVNVVTNSGIGLFIPVFLNYLARPVLAIAYAIGCLYYIHRVLPAREFVMHDKSGRASLPGLRKWLVSFLVLQVVMYVLYLSIFVLDGVLKFELRFLLDDTPLLFLSGFAFSLLSVVPHFYPHIIYGFEPVSPSMRGRGSGPSTSLATPFTTGGGELKSQASHRNEESDSHTSETELSDSQLQDLDAAITEYLTRTEAFCDPDFSIKSLSSGVGVPAYQLNYYIRYYLNTRFIDFKMKFRMEKARKLFEADEATLLTIQAISQRCGYAHRSTFLEHFKKVHGITPSEMIKTLSSNT